MKKIVLLIILGMFSGGLSAAEASSLCSQLLDAAAKEFLESKSTKDDLITKAKSFADREDLFADEVQILALVRLWQYEQTIRDDVCRMPSSELVIKAFEKDAEERDYEKFSLGSLDKKDLDEALSGSSRKKLFYWLTSKVLDAQLSDNQEEELSKILGILECLRVECLRDRQCPSAARDPVSSGDDILDAFARLQIVDGCGGAPAEPEREPPLPVASNDASGGGGGGFGHEGVPSLGPSNAASSADMLGGGFGSLPGVTGEPRAFSSQEIADDGYPAGGVEERKGD